MHTKTELNEQDLRKRILQISFDHKLSHIGSCLSILPILIDIYNTKEKDEKVILSCGHAALTLYVVLEAVYGSGVCDAEKMLKDWGIHQERDINRHVHSSGGSLGKGILIATGMALGSRDTDVHCVMSDGESREGSVFEALNFKNEIGLSNLKIYVNANSWSAYKAIDVDKLEKVLHSICDDIKIYRTVSDMPFAEGLAAHYHCMTEEEYTKFV